MHVVTLNLAYRKNLIMSRLLNTFSALLNHSIRVLRLLYAQKTVHHPETVSHTRDMNKRWPILLPISHTRRCCNYLSWSCVTNMFFFWLSKSSSNNFCLSVAVSLMIASLSLKIANVYIKFITSRPLLNNFMQIGAPWRLSCDFHGVTWLNRNGRYQFTVAFQCFNLRKENEGK